MKLAYLPKKPKKFILIVIFLGFSIEFSGLIYGVQISDMFYHYTYFNDEKINIEEKYNIVISTTEASEDYPKEWESSKEFNSENTVKPIDSRYSLSRFFNSIQDEVSKYPPKSISKMLAYVFVVDELLVASAKASGAYSLDEKSIYINYKLNTTGFNRSKFSLKRTFHHEISSILLKNYNFNHDSWKAAHGQGFQYEIDKDPTYHWMHMRGYTDPIDKKTLYKRGLLRQYAETGVENDFNIYASVIFTNPKKMKRLIKEYPIIQRKYEVFKAFYLSIDAGFAPVFDKIDG